MGSSQPAVVRYFQKWSKEGGNAHGDQGLAQVIWSNTQATVAQTPREAKAPSERTVFFIQNVLSVADKQALPCFRCGSEVLKACKDWQP